MLDSDLANIYGTSTGRLNEQVRRNAKRFPLDFMFELTRHEFRALISQNAISKPGRGGRRKLPLAFTQEGVAMLSSVLHTPRAIEANIAIMRVFVRLRQFVTSHKELAEKLSKLEHKTRTHGKHIRSLFHAIHQLLAPPIESRPKIGFHPHPD